MNLDHILDMIGLAAGGAVIIWVGLWRWNVDRKRANAMLEANHEADIEFHKMLRASSAKRKAPAKPVISPYRLVQTNDGSMPPPPELHEPEPPKAAPGPTYRDPAKPLYRHVQRYRCACCGSVFVTRLDPTEIDIYDHCPACKKKGVYAT